MSAEKYKHHVVALGVSVALSLAVLGATSAAPAIADDAGFAAGAAAVPAPYDGYSAYAPAPAYGPPYYDYYGGDDTVLVRPAFPPGCGAGEPHC
jgi:hypothetical protein